MCKQAISVKLSKAMSEFYAMYNENRKKRTYSNAIKEDSLQ